MNVCPSNLEHIVGCYAKFCSMCGTRLVDLSCANCKSGTASTDRFCGNCGADLSGKGTITKEVA